MKMINQRPLLVLLVMFTMLFSSLALAAGSEPFGDQKAVKGGILTLHTIEFPKSFNYFTNNAADTAEVFELVYDSLMELDPTTLEYQPLIAKSWQVSSDKKIFIITIDPRAKWADGKPITAEDVKFTYDTIMNPKNNTSVMRMYIGRFQEPQLIDKYSIKFTAKTVHYNNFIALAGFNIIPKHLFAGKDFNKAFNWKLPAGSGPYVLTEVKEGRYYVLSRRKDYWADVLPHHRGTYNFTSIKYKVMTQDVAFEGFKKGDFDIYDDITPKRWVDETNTEHFKKNWVVKQKIYNYAPRGFRGIALNMRQPLLQDLRVRQALFYILDRKTIIDKIRFNEEKPLTSYWPSLYGTQTANFNVTYSLGNARELLKQAGFDKLDKSGYLINGKGQRLEFSLIYVRDDDEPWLTIYVNSCKNAGVKINLQKLSWATLQKKMEEYQFDMLRIGWTGTLFDDPEQLWHSKHIGEVGGSNLSGYNNKEVDRLIDSMPPIFEASRRIQIIKKIDSIIYKEIPYILLWDRDFNYLFYKNVFGHPKTVFTKYSGGIIKYWWFDPQKERSYHKAISSKQALPQESVLVYYDKLK